jgi:2-polyprenyl-6-methoxyphenol hydroxylase-like FAD-dependent oxidoreductase
MGSKAAKSCDVLIVGAGPVGMTLALELERFGLSCRIVDKTSAPTDKSKALVVWPRTLELFDRASIAEDLVAAGFWAKGATMYGNGKRLVHVNIHRHDTAFPLPLMIPQNETERVLNESLRGRGVRVEREVELVELKLPQDGGRKAEGGNEEQIISTLRHADGREEVVTSSWLAGCDGAHSTVRKQLRIPFAGEFEPNDWMLADVHADGPIAPDEISAYWHSQGVLIFFPMSPGRFRVIADLGKAPGTDKPADPTLDNVQTLVDNRGPAGIRVHDPIWLSGFRIHERKVNEYQKGRAFLCGDAAHIHSPAGGQGMNTGMQDAFNLAWKLALVHKGQAKPSLLASYTQERSAVGDMVLRDAGLFTRVAMIRNPVLQFMRNHMMALAGKLSAVQERAIAQLTEMAVHYPDSPLTADDPGDAWRGDVRSGDRLPDAELQDTATGKTVRLLKSIGGSEHTVLVIVDEEAEPGSRKPEDTVADHAAALVDEFSGLLKLVVVSPAAADSTGNAAAKTLIDSQGQLRDRLGVRGAAIALVRPDGYISFRGHRQSWPALREHLASYLLSSQSGKAEGRLDSRMPQMV